MLVKIDKSQLCCKKLLDTHTKKLKNFFTITMNEENNVTNITNQTVEIMDHEKLVHLLDFYWTEE